MARYCRNASRTFVPRPYRTARSHPSRFDLAPPELAVAILSSFTCAALAEEPVSTEIENLRSQSVTSSSWGGRRTAPYAFTEHGVAMLSSVLKSPRAVVVNIDIMRAFVQLRRMAAEHGDLTRRLDELEKRFDSNFQAVFEAIRALIVVETSPKKRVGYLKANEKT